MTGTLWLAMLIVQPWAIRSGRRALHVGIGRASVLLFALVIVGFVGLAHASMQGKSPAGQAVDAYFFYVRVVLALDFHTWGAPWTAWKALASQFAALPII